MELAASGSFRVGFVIDPSLKKLPPRNCLCLINSIHLEHEKKTKKKNSKNDFVIRADQVCAPLKFFGKCFSTLLSCSLLHGRCPFSRSHRDQMGPSSLSLSASQPLSLAASQPRSLSACAGARTSAKALSHLSTEDQRAPRCLQPHSCCTCQTSFSAPLPLLFCTCVSKVDH